MTILLRFALFAMLLLPGRVEASGWKQVFVDQFDGIELDREQWATRYVYGDGKLDHLNDEKQVYRDNRNHLVEDGVLSLVARPVGEGKFESGMIRSRRTFYYGYFEARVFLPRGRGVWPAFWLNPDYDGEGKLSWPPEIDVFEYAVNGRDDTDAMFHTAASSVGADSTIAYLAMDRRFSTKLKRFDAGRPLNEGWHVFGLVWAPDRITVFLDGALVFSRPYRWSRRDGTLGGPAHILLNFAVGGSWAGRYGIDADAFPQAFRIDYVRVCQFTAGGQGGRRCGDSAFTPDPGLYGYAAPFDDLARPRIGPASLDGRKAIGEELPARPGQTFRLRVPMRLPAGGKAPLEGRLTVRSPTGKKLAERSVPILPGDPRAVTFDLAIPATGLSPTRRYPVTFSIGPVGAANTSVTLSCGSDARAAIPQRSCRVTALNVTP